MPLCDYCRSQAEIVNVDTGDPEDYEMGDGLFDSTCDRCGLWEGS